MPTYIWNSGWVAIEYPVAKPVSVMAGLPSGVPAIEVVGCSGGELQR